MAVVALRGELTLRLHLTPTTQKVILIDWNFLIIGHGISPSWQRIAPRCKSVEDYSMRSLSPRLGLSLALSLTSSCRFWLDVHVSAIIAFLATILALVVLAYFRMIEVTVLAFSASPADKEGA